MLWVWADEQEWQNGVTADVHTNFKLSAAGEAIGLFTPTPVQVDAITFAAQQPDQSHGRYPDGQTQQVLPLDQSTPRFPNIPPLGY